LFLAPINQILRVFSILLSKKKFIYGALPMFFTKWLSAISIALILFATSPTFGFKFPSTDFIKRGFFHCLDGKKACTKRSDLCTNQTIFDECYEKCIHKRRPDTKTSLILDQLLKCPAETLLKSKFSANLTQNAEKYGKKLPQEKIKVEEKKPEQIKTRPRSKTIIHAPKQEAPLEHKPIIEQRRPSIKDISPQVEQKPVIEKRRESIKKEESPIESVVEQKPIIEQRRSTIKDVSPQVEQKPVIEKQLPQVEIYSVEKPVIEKRRESIKQESIKKDQSPIESVVEQKPIIEQRRPSIVEQKKPLVELKKPEIKKEPPLKTQLKGESKFVDKNLGKKETQPSKTVLPLNYKLLLQLAEDLKKIENLPNDLRECLQNTNSTAPGTITNAIRGFSVKSGGGTQSQNFIVCDEFFVQRYRMNNMEVSDRKAAEGILERIKGKPSYNMFVRSYLFTRGSGGNQFRDIGIYPYLKDAKDFSKATPEMFYQLGAAFAQLHKDSLVNGKSLSYEDLQPSNFLYTAAGEIKFIDYGGLTMEPIDVVYQRIKEFIQTFAHSANEKEQFLLGYESILPNGIPGLDNR
jgi:hypothetical protein